MPKNQPKEALHQPGQSRGKSKASARAEMPPRKEGQEVQGKEEGLMGTRFKSPGGAYECEIKGVSWRNKHGSGRTRKAFCHGVRRK